MLKLKYLFYIMFAIAVYFLNLSDYIFLKEKSYAVKRLDSPMIIDGNWDKPQWKKINAVCVSNFLGVKPKFKPNTQVKMMYDDSNLYLIFKVKDRYVRSINNNINGNVWEDSCVEFFFSPYLKSPDHYFNLETNCGGTSLMRYNTLNNILIIDKSIIEKIEIAHSLPKENNPEIEEPVTWTLEYKLPLNILQKYTKIDFPKKGIKWKVNFYKIAENNSNPHYATWSPIKNSKVNFHQPEYFGNLVFN